MQTLTMREVFEECQENMTSHPKLLRALTKQFKKVNTKDGMDQFADNFITYVKYSLVIGEQVPLVDRTLDFVVKFITAVDSECADDENDDGEIESLSRCFVSRCRTFFLKFHGACSQAVRYRICQLIAKLLNLMSDEAEMNEDTFTKLQMAMIERLYDKVPIVRVQAANALFRLQDPADDTCPVTKAFLRHLRKDPHADVRCAILKSLLPSSKALIRVLERTRDVKETVRMQAYEFLAVKVHIRSLAISQRVRLLRQGLKDRSEMVQKTLKKTVLPAWFHMLNDDLLDFVRCLDVHAAPDITELAVKELLTKTCNEQFVDSLVAKFLDEKRIIREDVLSVESVFLWRVVCEYLRSLGKQQSDELLEKILPDLPTFCPFINTYILSYEKDEIVLDLVDKEFISEQMVKITHLYDLVDEAHRKCLHELVKCSIEMPKVGKALVVLAVKILKAVIPNSLDRAQYLMEAITEIREPIDVVEVQQTPQQTRHNELKMAKLRVEVNVVREEMETCVVQQDFEGAQVAKQRLHELEETMAQHRTEQRPQTQEVRIEKNDVLTLNKCLALVCEIFLDNPFKLDVNRQRSLVDNLVLHCVGNESNIVRHSAVRALGLACILNADLASQHFILLLQMSKIDCEEVRLMALEVIFDLVMLNGLEMTASDELPLEQDDLDETSLTPMADSDCGNTAVSDSCGKILSLLLMQLDSEVSAINTLAAEGLSKLLLAGRVVSPKTVSRLIIMWFSPVNQDNEYLLNCLGVFFPLFAASSVANRAMIAGAFMPTLRTLFKAPTSSPLSIVDVLSVGSFMVQLTITPKKQERHLEPNNLHDSLAVTVCNEILRSPKHFGVPLMVDLLRQFHITQTKHSLLRNLSALSKSIIQKVKDRRTLLKLKRLSADIDALLQKIVTGTEAASEDEESLRIVPETPPDYHGKQRCFSESSTSEDY